MEWTPPSPGWAEEGSARSQAWRRAAGVKVVSPPSGVHGVRGEGGPATEADGEGGTVSSPGDSFPNSPGSSGSEEAGYDSSGGAPAASDNANLPITDGAESESPEGEASGWEELAPKVGEDGGSLAARSLSQASGTERARAPPMSGGGM